MVDFSGDKHYKLIVNDKGMIEGIEIISISVILCKKCGYARVKEEKVKKKLPIQLPKELVYAIAEELLSFIYHKL